MYVKKERMAKKPNNRLFTVIQNSPKTVISEHLKGHKFDKDSQKKVNSFELEDTCGNHK